MNNVCKLILFCLLPLSIVLAQEEIPAKKDSPTSSLKLSKDRTDNERVEFLVEVAQAYTKEENFDAAIDAYERILLIDPNHLQSRYIITQLYIRAKQYTKAKDLLLILAAEFPEDFKLLNNLAWLYATADDPAIRNGKKAVKVAQEALTIAPNDHHVWSTLSEAYYISGDYEKAYRAIRHMASLAARSESGITKDAVDSYNEQIRKCKRAMDTAEVMKKDEAKEEK